MKREDERVTTAMGYQLNSKGSGYFSPLQKSNGEVNAFQKKKFSVEPVKLSNKFNNWTAFENVVNEY